MWRTFTAATGLYCGCLSIAFGQPEDIAVVVTEGPFLLKGSYVVGHVTERSQEMVKFQPCKGSEIDVKGELLVKTELTCADQPGEPHMLAKNCREFLTESIALTDIDVRKAELGSEYYVAPASPDEVSVWVDNPPDLIAAMYSGNCATDFVNVNGAIGIPIDVFRGIKAGNIE